MHQDKDNQIDNLFETLASTEVVVGHTVHSNTHNHALVENPFAWEDQEEGR